MRNLVVLTFVSNGIDDFAEWRNNRFLPEGRRSQAWFFLTWSLSIMIIEFNGHILFWRGPAPWYFIGVPETQSRDLKAISGFVTYGWGVIPVHVRIGKTEWKTSLFPKDGRYLVPIRANVREAENLAIGDEVAVRLEVH